MTRLKSARHAVTFRDIRLLPFLIRVERLPPIDGAQTPALRNFGRLAISNATRKIVRVAIAHIHGAA